MSLGALESAPLAYSIQEIEKAGLRTISRIAQAVHNSLVHGVFYGADVIEVSWRSLKRK